MSREGPPKIPLGKGSIREEAPALPSLSALMQEAEKLLVRFENSPLSSRTGEEFIAATELSQAIDEAREEKLSGTQLQQMQHTIMQKIESVRAALPESLRFEH